MGVRTFVHIRAYNTCMVNMNYIKCIPSIVNYETHWKFSTIHTTLKLMNISGEWPLSLLGLSLAQAHGHKWILGCLILN